VTAASEPPARSQSIVTRLTLFHGVALFLLCALISYFLDAATRAALTADLRQMIDAEVKQIAAVIVQSDAPVEDVRRHLRTFAEARPTPRLAMRVREGDQVVALHGDADRILAPGTPTPHLQLERALVVHAGTSTATRQAFTDERPAGVRASWDYSYGEVVDPRGRFFRIEVMGHRSQIDKFIGRFRTNLVTLVSPLMIAAIVVARLFLRRTIAPLSRVTAAAARIGSRTLGERLDARRAPVEIARLVGTFNEMLDRLEDAFRRLTEFGGDLAHEMRTPLQNLRGQAEVALLNPRSAEEYREILGDMIEECDRLARIVDDVLLLSRVERHEEALVRTRFDLAAEVVSILEFFEYAATSRGVALAPVESAGPLEVDGDRLKLRRAIGNLVDNAIKYTDEGGRVSVSVRRASGSEVLVLVSDTGHGIAPEHQARLFERFYRVDKSRSRNTGGAGLGLGIARTIARAHGGDVKIESEPGKGTRVGVTLPG